MLRKIWMFLLFYLLINYSGLAQSNNALLRHNYDSTLTNSLHIQLKIDSLQNILDNKIREFSTDNVSLKKEIQKLKQHIFLLQEEANIGYKKAKEIERIKLQQYLREKKYRDSLEFIRQDSLRKISCLTNFLLFLESQKILNIKHLKSLKDLNIIEKRNVNIIENNNKVQFQNLKKKEVKTRYKALKTLYLLNLEKYQIYTMHIHLAKEKCEENNKLQKGRAFLNMAKESFIKAKLYRSNLPKGKHDSIIYKKYLEVYSLFQKSIKWYKKAYVTYLFKERSFMSQELEMPEDTILYNEFAMLPYCPYSEQHPIPLNVQIPSVVIYKIQLGIFSNPIPFNKFAGISPVSGETLENIDAVKYYAGLFSRLEDAERALVLVHSEGFEDAYIVSFKNGEKISTAKASEFQQNKISKKIFEPIKLMYENVQNEILIFKIQVGVYTESIPLYVLDILKKNIGDKKITQQQNKKGQNVYAIEKFNTFEEAQKMKNRLVENGLTDVFVTAFEKGERISLKRALSIQNQ